MSTTLADGMVGAFHYTLKDGDGKTLDSSKGRQPMVYLHGHKNIVPGLEKALEGQATGATMDVVVPPAEGYGEASGLELQAVPKREFPKDMPIREGMPIRAQGSDGQEVILWIHELRGSRVMLSTDHPLAGTELHFSVEIIAVRDATPDELTHGHAHSLDGHAQHH